MNGIFVYMILFYDPFFESVLSRYTQSTLVLQRTIPPLFKSQYSLLMNICLQIKQSGVLFLFLFHLDTSDDSTPLITTIPPFVESISLTPMHACMCTSLANSLFSSSTRVVLPMDNLLKASTTTLALPGDKEYSFHNP